MLPVDEIDDEAPEFGGVLDLVLGLPEDEPEHAPRLPEFLQDVPVMEFELFAVELPQGSASRTSAGTTGGSVVGRLGLLLCHLEEEQESQLLDVVAVG